MLILLWFQRSLHFAQVSQESCPWPLKLMTSQRVERTWIRTGSYGRFRGEWVNDCRKFLKHYKCSRYTLLLRTATCKIVENTSFTKGSAKIMVSKKCSWSGAHLSWCYLWEDFHSRVLLTLDVSERQTPCIYFNLHLLCVSLHWRLITLPCFFYL